jgi:hypothetical protein
MHLGGAVSFCLQKTNHTTDVTAGGSGDEWAHVYSVATRAQLNKLDSGLAFSKITLYWLLPEMRRVAAQPVLLHEWKLVKLDTSSFKYATITLFFKHYQTF